MFMDKPILHGPRIQLRPLLASDVDAFLAGLEDPESTRLTGTQQTFTREQIQHWCATRLEQEDRIDYVILRSESATLMGEVVLNEIDFVNRNANLRIALWSGFTDQGFGSEAIRLVLEHAFLLLNLNRVGLEVYAFNPRAQHVYQKLGFKTEGVLREVLLQDGVFADAIIMGMLRSEFLRDRDG